MDPVETIKELCRAWTVGYGLDCGGYEFEWVGEPMASHLFNEQGMLLQEVRSMLAWDDPAWDYFPFGEIHGSREIYLLLIVPGDNVQPDWPDEFVLGDYEYSRVSRGEVYGSDRECHCRGRLVPWCGAAGEPPVCDITPKKLADWAREGKFPIGLGWNAVAELHLSFRNTGWFWQFTGDLTGPNPPYPECTNCEGSGTFDSPGGAFAIYTMKQVEEED